jgi:hypothetical protein
MTERCGTPPSTGGARRRAARVALLAGTLVAALALGGCDRLVLRGEGGPDSGADWAVGLRL